MASSPSRLPVIRIAGGTFYRRFPGSQSAQTNPSLFDGLTFELASSGGGPHNWCVVGPSLSGKTTFLQVLRGRLLCQPPTARTYPSLAVSGTRWRVPEQAVRYVGFEAEVASAYLSARYESRREATDFSVEDFLLGNTALNPLGAASGAGQDDGAVSAEFVDRVVGHLSLRRLLHLPVTALSNGQGRRARIARALLTRPDLLLLDEPFMGLDPHAAAELSSLLRSLADKTTPRLVLTARPQDPLPAWITHLVYLRSDCQVESMGPKDVVLDRLRKYIRGVRLGEVAEDEKLPIRTMKDVGKVMGSAPTSSSPSSLLSSSSSSPLSRKRPGAAAAAAAAAAADDLQGDVHALAPTPINPDAEPLVEMDGCRVQYGDEIVLGNWSQQTAGRGGQQQQQQQQQQRDGLVWTVRRGERWGVFGPNGSGKTTIVSLLSSDHPQAYSVPIRLFGRSRLPDRASGERPLTFWDIQSRIGHCSPEVHRQMPRGHSVRRVVENAWAATLGTHALLDGAARRRVDAALGWFAAELNGAAAGGARASLSWADETTFGELALPAQRVALFLRCVIKAPDVVVLDEAFSGMDDAVRDKCALFLEHGEHKTLRGGEVVVSEQAERGTAVVGGLSHRQALVCIAHVKEEVPDCVREWICLPGAGTGRAPRFGRFDGPLGSDVRRWEEVWGFGA